MNCEQVEQLLTRYALGELSEKTESIVRLHLNTCDRCRALAERIEPTLDLLRDALAVSLKAPGTLSGERRTQILQGVPSASAGQPVQERVRKPAARPPERKPIMDMLVWFTESHPRFTRAAAILVVCAGLWVLSGKILWVYMAPMYADFGVALPSTATSPLLGPIGPFTPQFKMGEVVGAAPAEVKLVEPEESEELAVSSVVTDGYTSGTRLPTPASGKAKPETRDARSSLSSAPDLAKELERAEQSKTRPMPATTVEPDVPFSPVPAPLDSVAIVKSPVIMKGTYGSRSPGARAEALRRYGGGADADENGRQDKAMEEPQKNVPSDATGKKETPMEAVDAYKEASLGVGGVANSVSGVPPAPARPTSGSQRGWRDSTEGAARVQDGKAAVDPFAAPAPEREVSDRSNLESGRSRVALSIAGGVETPSTKDAAQQQVLVDADGDDALRANIPLPAKGKRDSGLSSVNGEMALPPSAAAGTVRLDAPGLAGPPGPSATESAPPAQVGFWGRMFGGTERRAKQAPADVSYDYALSAEATRKAEDKESDTKHALKSAPAASAPAPAVATPAPVVSSVRERNEMTSDELQETPSPQLHGQPAGQVADGPDPKREKSQGNAAEIAGRSSAVSAPVSIQQAQQQQTVEKLRKTVIPEIDFRQANIRDVVDFLEQSSAEFGKPTDNKKTSDKPVAINLNLGQDVEKAADGIPLITFSARNITAEDALKIVTQVAGLKYQTEGDTVNVVPINAPDGELVVKMYYAPKEVLERIPASASAAKQVDASVVTATNVDSVEASDWKDFYRSLGVSWPAGSSIKYIPSLNKLVVANTLDNLEQFERITSSLAVKPAEPPVSEKTVEAEDPTGPRFKAFGVNPFVDAVKQAFSTFSIDVDTASYTLARNYAMRGWLPPAEAVRTEEFVNFFDYGYKPPVNKTFAVYTECAPSKFGHGLSLLKIGVKGKRLGREEQKPAALLFLIDTSGSMNQPDRLGLVRTSLKLLIDTMDPHDRVAILQYDSHARLVLEYTPVSERQRIRDALDALQCGGSTNLEEGMLRAYELAAAHFVEGAENRVMLLSDGVANLGNVAAEDILKRVEAYRRQGITCSVFGVGMGTYNDEMLEALANKGDGTYAFIDSEAEARRVLVDDLAATLNTIASDVKIQVEFNPRCVKQYRQLGYENRQLKKEDFRNDAIDAGEIGSGQSVTALYELELQGKADGPIGTVRIRYRRADTHQVEELEQKILVSDIRRSFDDADVRFRLAAAVAEYAEILRASPFAEGGSFEEVADVLRPVALDLTLDERVQELLRMVSAAGGLSRGPLDLK